MLAPNGHAIILVPQGQWNFGTLDEVLGHKRRYSREALTKLAQDTGFEIEKMISFNRAGTLPWYVSGRLVKRRTVSLLQIKIFNWLVPLARLLDGILPIPPLSLIAVLKPKSH